MYAIMCIHKGQDGTCGRDKGAEIMAIIPLL